MSQVAIFHAARDHKASGAIVDLVKASSVGLRKIVDLRAYVPRQAFVGSKTDHNTSSEWSGLLECFTRKRNANSSK